MFRSVLDKSFASHLVPLKPALTMMSNVNRSPMPTHHLMRTNTNSVVKSAAQTASAQKTTALKTNLMNASKISVSSDSSQSDDRSEVQLCSPMLNATHTSSTTTPSASTNNSTLSTSHHHSHHQHTTKENVSNFLNRLSNIPHFLVQATATSPASSSSASSTQNIPVQLISSTPITSISHHNLNTANNPCKPKNKEKSTDLCSLSLSMSSRSTLPQYGNSSNKAASLASPLSTPTSK